MKLNSKKKGFTLIELIGVIAIIALLMVILLPNLSLVKTSAKDTGASNNALKVKGQLDVLVNDFTSYNTVDAVADKAAGSLNVVLAQKFTDGSVAITPGTTLASAVKTTVQNYLTKSNVITAGVTGTPIPALAPAVYVCTADPSAANLLLLKGSVIVKVDTANNKFVVYSVDSTGVKGISYDVQ